LLLLDRLNSKSQFICPQSGSKGCENASSDLREKTVIRNGEMITMIIRVCGCFFLCALLMLAIGNAQPATRSSSDIVWNFDHPRGAVVHDSAADIDDPIQGFWRRMPGVRGQALEFDGYTTGILRDAKAVPQLGNAFTVSAWLALNNYPWNWLPIVEQSDNQQVGYFVGIDAFGHVGFDVSVNGVWRQLTTEQTLPLKKWVHVTAVFKGDSGLTILVDGKRAATLNALGTFWQASSAMLFVGRVRTPQVPFPGWISHPQDPIQYSLDGYLDEVRVLNHAASKEQDSADVSAAQKPEGDVIPYAVLPAGPPSAGPFGAMNATLHYFASWDRLRRLGPDSDVVVRFEQSPMRLVFWQGANYIPVWVTENGKWYTDEFLETWGPGCGGAGDCEPMSDKQSRYSHVSILQSSPARAVIHWRYALAEARNYEGAHADPLTGWFDWADEYWTVYPDGVAVRKQVLWSSALDATHEWQETIIINGPGQRPEDNIEADALTLENMAGETATYHWQPKTDQTFALPKGPSKLDRPEGANIQIVHLKSAENPFQIVSPKGVSFDTYNGEPSYSMFEWWNHWPVAQVGSSGRPAVAPDRASHSSLSHIYWPAYSQTPDSMTKLLLCGLTDSDAASLLPLAKSWISPPPGMLIQGAAGEVQYDPSQRAFVVLSTSKGDLGRLTIRVSSAQDSPLVNPAFVVEDWNTPARVTVSIDGKKVDVPVRLGIEHHLEGDSLVLFLKFQSTRLVQIEIDPAKD
jgi:hypothetical protein